MKTNHCLDWMNQGYVLLSQFLLIFINISSSQVLFEEINAANLHPRTFHLSPNQEFEVISKVLCEGLPCPEYSIMQDHPYFIQQRSYRAFTFLRLTTPITCMFKFSVAEGAKRMKKYIEGANNRDQVYSPTLPLLIEIEHTGSKSTNPWCVMKYSANFYTPHFWGIMATPTEIFEEVGSLPDNLQVYVHTFSGDVSDVLLREIELFRRNLDTLGFCYKKKKFYVAIYNIPHNPNDSRNELWFTKCTK
ncbi:uncharacterized protein TNIN_82421 [Trichonephila inaurata madagascariensis]|uniref:Heme-binding protein 2 n=1 Tax=Trichonephila inaurata madagascariensis TaxID=2747483 RepID=A0A8X6XLX7_9ARAC|nr:uncharacterized protein TNIN_82421 [Trichonephila inaurata madagascariensis]